MRLINAIQTLPNSRIYKYYDNTIAISQENISLLFQNNNFLNLLKWNSHNL
jgi:hypothetical protein